MTAPGATLEVPLEHGHSGVSMSLSMFGLLGGPLAWFLEICSGYGFSSWACFPKDQRLFAPLEGFGWTRSVVVAICIASFVVAAASFMVSRRIRLQMNARLKTGNGGTSPLSVRRTRFLAMWGMAAGGGFAVAVALTAVALIILPQCAG